MAFTDHSDMFAAVHESGINATISQLILQRPSMFNYATILFTQARLPITVAMPGRGASPTARRGRPWSGPGDHGFDPAAAHILAGQSIVLLVEPPPASSSNPRRLGSRTGPGQRAGRHETGHPVR